SVDWHLSRNRRGRRPLRGFHHYGGGRARDGFSIGRWFAVPLCIGAAIAALVCWSGVPLLRHDWGIPVRNDALGPALQTLFQPWLLRGMGEPQSYPTAYLLG